MQRCHQILFTIALAALSWYSMMGVHELGHVVGAVVTGGTVQRVVLHPFAISRTDVAPNPHPAAVVWLGPIVGCALPLAVAAIVPPRPIARRIARFFAGFCLVANGAYISIGSCGRVGDCGEMLRTGTPPWTLILFGAITIPLGLYLWHCLGSLRHFINNPSAVTARMAYIAGGVLIVLMAVGFASSPR